MVSTTAAHSCFEFDRPMILVNGKEDGLTVNCACRFTDTKYAQMVRDFRTHDTQNRSLVNSK